MRRFEPNSRQVVGTTLRARRVVELALVRARAARRRRAARFGAFSSFSRASSRMPSRVVLVVIVAFRGVSGIPPPTRCTGARVVSPGSYISARFDVFSLRCRISRGVCGLRRSTIDAMSRIAFGMFDSVGLTARRAASYAHRPPRQAGPAKPGPWTENLYCPFLLG